MDLIDFAGVVVKRQMNGADGQPPHFQTMTIEGCCSEALQHLYQDERATLEQKVIRFRLAMKFAAVEPGGELPTLKAEDVVELKKVVGMYWNPLVVGRVLEVYDPKALE